MKENKDRSATTILLYVVIFVVNNIQVNAFNLWGYGYQIPFPCNLNHSLPGNKSEGAWRHAVHFNSPVRIDQSLISKLWSCQKGVLITYSELSGGSHKLKEEKYKNIIVW